MNKDRLGSATPNFIAERIDDINAALEECMPFQDFDHPQNEWLLEVAERESAKIVDFVKAVREVHKGQTNCHKNVANLEVQKMINENKV